MRRPLIFVACALSGAALGYALGQFLEDGSPRPELTSADKLGLALGLAGAGFLAILAHEFGHALAAMCCGWQFRFVAAGPLLFERGTRGLRLRFNRLPAGFGGLALCLPLDDASLRRGAPWFYAGGPLGSLAFAGLSGTLFWSRGARLDGAWAGTLLGAAAISVLIALATLLLPGGEIPNDGERLWRWLRRHPRAQAEAGLLRLWHLALAGVRPRDWPEAALRELDLDDSPRGAVSREMMLAAAEIDAGRRGAGLERLERLAGDWSKVSRPMVPPLAIELTLLGALEGRPVAELEGWWLRAQKGFSEPWRRAAAEAALAWRHGRTEQARGILDRARKHAQGPLFPLGAGDHELLAELGRLLGAD